MNTKFPKMVAVLASLFAAANAGAAIATPQENDASGFVAELAENGKIQIDEVTGKVELKSSLLGILRDAGLVTELKTEEIKSLAAGESSGACCSRQN